VDTFGCQQVCRRPIATLLPRRLADKEAAKAFRSGWNEANERRFSLSSSRRTSEVRSTTGLRRTVRRLGPGTSPTVVPTSGLDLLNPSQAQEQPFPSDTPDSGLAEATMAQRSVENEQQSGEIGRSVRSTVGSPPQAEPEVAPVNAGNQPLSRGRSQGRMALADAALRRMGTQVPTPGILRSMQLISDFAWSGRTAASRQSQWKAWVEFCTADERPVLPATEAHFIAFVGWLTSERESGRRSVSSTSLPQYFSAVRQMQITLIGIEVPQYPFLQHVIRAYERWEEQNYPATEVRCGISATMIQAIWGLGMSTSSPSILRDCAMTLLSYCFNGLRESSVVSLQAQNVTVDEDHIHARLSVVKGRQASRQQLVSYKRLGPHPSPVDLLMQWSHGRGRHPKYFGLDGERDPIPARALDDALKRCLTTLNLSPPPHGKYTSHSLRIGSHTEQVLLGFPLEVRLARFGWGPNSGDMAATYFDRTIMLSPASFWVFGHPTQGLEPASPAVV